MIGTESFFHIMTTHGWNAQNNDLTLQHKMENIPVVDSIGSTLIFPLKPKPPKIVNLTNVQTR